MPKPTGHFAVSVPLSAPCICSRGSTPPWGPRISTQGQVTIQKNSRGSTHWENPGDINPLVWYLYKNVLRGRKPTRAMQSSLRDRRRALENPRQSESLRKVNQTPRDKDLLLT